MESFDYNIGDIIYNVWKDKFYVIVDFEYKDTSKYYTISDLISQKLIINEWLYSKRLIWNKGNFNGYEIEYRMSSKAEALSKYRKDKIKNLLSMEDSETESPSDTE